MMEERLQASESLFGGLMDFRGGLTSGQQAERLQSAIGWLRNEFLTQVNESSLLNSSRSGTGIEAPTRRPE
jgi:hypothetical protein